MAKALSCSRLNAFCLFELLLVLALLSILTCVCVGSFVFFGSKQQFIAVKYRIRSALGFARSEAMLRGESVVYCGSRDQVHCDGHWVNGQLIKTFQGQRLQVYPAIPKGVSLTFVANFGRNTRVVFNPQGFTAGEQGHFELCTSEFKQCSILRLHYSGQVVDGKS